MAEDRHENLDVAQRLLRVGMVLLVLLFLPGLAHPFAVPKEAVVLLVTAFALFATTIGGEPSLTQWPWGWNAALLALVAAATVSALANGSGLLASDGAVRFWGYAAFVLALRLACPAEADMRRLLRLAAGLGGLEGLLLLLQVLAGQHAFDFSALPSVKWRSFGTLGNPNWVGALLAATLPLAAAYSERASGAERLGWQLTSTAILTGLVLTLSRGAWAAAAAGGIVLVLLSGGRMACRLVTTCAVAFPLAVGAALAGFGGSELAGELTQTASMVGRWRMWRITASLIAARPVLGWGPGRFAGIYPTFQRIAFHDQAPAIAVTDVTNHPHSDYLFFGVEAGLVGLAAFCILLALVLRHAVARDARREAAPLAAALVALAVHGIVDVPLRLPATTAVFCLVVVAVLDYKARASPASLRPLSVPERVGVALIMTLALVQSVRLLLVDRWLQGARDAWVAGRPAEAEQLALRGLRFEPTHGELWDVLARARLRLGDDDGAFVAAREAQRTLPTADDAYIIAAIERRRGRHEEAIEELRALHETLPGLIRPRVLLAETYLEAGQSDQARAMLLQVLSMHAKFPSAEEDQLRARAAELMETLAPP